ncbi:flagellar export chaperone FliS [Bacillus sp. FSL W8-0116]|uniref:flagellar export chaperone FliS n=1 Tax=Bacillus sp. FSL W8-0116 TaxID=2978206 RepID=UPI0030F9E07A
MAINNPYQAYEKNAVSTASPGELTLMLYNGCLKFMLQAKKAIEDKNFEKKNTYIQKAQNIIRELMVTLNMDVELSKNLMAVYDYMNRRLIQANVKNDLEILDEVMEFITELRDTWKQAIQEQRKQQYGTGGRV